MAKSDAVRILVAGDYCPRERQEALIRRGRVEELFGSVLPALRGADLSIVNLECALCTRGRPIRKSGPNLKVHPDAAAALTAAGFDAACLANNHILDFGGAGLAATLDVLKRRRIGRFGAELSLAAARRPLTVRRGGVRISMLGFAENEFTCADDRSAGAAPLDPVTNIRQIARARGSCDVLLVFVHGGNEHLPFPSPRMVRTYRAFAEAGASAVIAGHPHTPQGVEVHGGVPIFYSLGNFVFDWPGETTTMWWRGCAVEMEATAAGVGTFRLIPFRTDVSTACLSLLAGAERKHFERYVRFLSRPIRSEEAIRRYFDAWCVMKGPTWLKFLDLPRRLPAASDAGRRQLLVARNAVNCEAHHELIARYLELLRKGRTGGLRREVRHIRTLQAGRVPRA